MNKTMFFVALLWSLLWFILWSYFGKIYQVQLAIHKHIDNNLSFWRK